MAAKRAVKIESDRSGSAGNKLVAGYIVWKNQWRLPE